MAYLLVISIYFLNITFLYKRMVSDMHFIQSEPCITALPAVFMVYDPAMVSVRVPRAYKLLCRHYTITTFSIIATYLKSR